MTNQEEFSSKGLYSPEDEHGSCGVGLVVNISGSKFHEIIDRGLTVLENMAHRGAEGSDEHTGDGAGILVQIPHEFILLNGIPVPEKGRYGVAVVFLPREENDNQAFKDILDECIKANGLTTIHSRIVPVNSDILGETARSTEPEIRQIFIGAGEESDNLFGTERDNEEDNGFCKISSGSKSVFQNALEDKLYLTRKCIERKVAASSIKDKKSCYVVSLSTRTMVYKGMLKSKQLRKYFPDLTNKYFTSSIALVHARFSTNTFPTWSLAQPFRMIGHNGEINTIRGNRLWIKTRESLLQSETLGDINKNISPIVEPGMSDSASLDNVLEFFVRSGMSIPHTLSMLIPESYKESNPLGTALKSYYEYHSIFMEPWDGPATILFTDGRYAGGMLDRNGLRPCRYFVTKNGVLVMASETGACGVDPSEIASKGRLYPGKILMVDTKRGKIIRDESIKEELANEYPYEKWLASGRIILKDIKSGRKIEHKVNNFTQMLGAFNYTAEDIDRIIVPMAANSAEPLGAMGDDTPLAVLSSKSQLFFNYFRQKFAQVTNPPIDPIREATVMSLTSYIGSVKSNILEQSPNFCKVVKLNTPILSDSEIETLRNLQYKGFKTITLPMTFPAGGGVEAMEQSIGKLCKDAEGAIDAGYNYLIISDKSVDKDNAPIPSLLALSAVHHHLIHCKKRSKTALIVESGEVREIMHVALLVGYGASGVNPYMAFAILDSLVKDKQLQLDYPAAEEHYINAISKGLLKIISKMGISTIRSYRGAALFETLGISSEVLDKYMGGGISQIEGVTMEDIAKDAANAHKKAFDQDNAVENPIKGLEDIGQYSYRKDGELHGWNPQVVKMLKDSVRAADYEQFKKFCVAAENRTCPMNIRDLMEIESDRKSIPIEEVESEESIIKRFVVEAISFGAISKEAHETLAIAMNEIGGMSNTGEGGEDPERNKPLPDGRSARSAVKQVASGRFGVDTYYLVNADEIQIKVAQGAKPGEGGQLPGFKVNELIAKTRHSIPGITLISPPPHHDIYSIEDLAQLIFDLKNVNNTARISVKLVSEAGIGTIAAGVAKAKADVILISGADGGTGASPMSSTRYAGSPATIGLAQVQQTLVMNNLRGKVRLQVDGGLKCGRDVMFMALLGAEEFGFGTAAMISMGCLMCRKCNTNTCPVGIATQNPELIKKFAGKPEHVEAYFHFLARDVREKLALMGYKSLQEIIGRADLLHKRKYPQGAKANKISLDRVLFIPESCKGNDRIYTTAQEHRLKEIKDKELMESLLPAIKCKRKITLGVPILNTDRSVGAMMSGEIVRQWGEEGLADDTINIHFNGSAGQSFGAFLCKGVTFTLEGDANDYMGKGLSGGKIFVLPPAESDFKAEDNIIAGNTIAYGATAGEMYINGQVGERFCVRNSGITAVVEGVGDHCCEYMTGGRVVVLGKTGRNFAAGMSGGIAYVWNPDYNFDFFCNMELVELSLVESDKDKEELLSLIKAHHKYTGSSVASMMIADWDRFASQFIKVIPVEYSRLVL
jgi:glutamate synthase (NADPH/NADH) large chain